jgi:hypothetical protein
MAKDAPTDAGTMQLLKFVQRGLEFVERHGLPGAKAQFFQGIREDGMPYTIQAVKELTYHPPLLEFRANWQGTGAFRAVFFEYPYNGKQILVFPRAIIKQTTASADFEQIISETELLLPNFYADPGKYINLQEVGQSD